MTAAQQLQQARDCLRQGNPALAEILCNQVLKQAPGHAEASGLLGLLRAQAGRLDEAAELLAQACRTDPGTPSHHFNLGLVHQQRNHHAEALAAFDAALQLSPHAVQAHHLRGLSLKHLGRFEEAVRAYDQAIAQQPAFVAALNNRATALRHLGQYGQAIEGYQQALQHQAGLPEIWSNLGLALAGDHQHAQALAAFERARALGDASPVTLMNMGVVLNELHRPAEALPLLEAAATALPDDANAQLNLGNALAGLDRAHEALARFQRALALNPDGDADAALNIANTLRDTEHCEDALPWYDRALAQGAATELVRWNRALCLLSMGDFRQGWRDYEARGELPSLGNGPRHFAQPLWRGEPVNGQTVLLHAEQGLGDTLQFCRYARRVAERGARVVLEVQPPLLQVLASLEGVAQLVGQGQALPPFDWHCPLMSLPLALGTELDSIPQAVPYLSADPQLVAHWRDALPQPGRKLQVGVAWAGNPDNWIDRRRSIPFDRFRAALPDCADYWSLQKTTPAPQGPGVEVLSFDRTEFAHTAAQIMALDLVVTVDTSIAHLAGALGRPVWILLPRPAEMRWLRDRNDSPWYPTARLFRQHTLGQWEGVLAEVAEALALQAAEARG